MKCMLIGLLLVSLAQEDSVVVTVQVPSPVVFEKDTLFYIDQNLGIFSAKKRAETISANIRTLSKLPEFYADSLKLSVQPYGHIILYDTLIILAVTDADTFSAGVSRDSLSRAYVNIIGASIGKYKKQRDTKMLIINVLLTMAVLAAVYFLFRLMAKYSKKTYRVIAESEETHIRSLAIHGQTIVSAGTIVQGFLFLARCFHLFLILLIPYSGLVIILSRFHVFYDLHIPEVMFDLSILVLTGYFSFGLIRMLNRLWREVLGRLETWKGTMIREIKYKSLSFMSEERQIQVTVIVIKFLRVAVNFIIMYFFITFALSLYDWSRTLADKLIDYITMPVIAIGTAFFDYLPNLFYIAVVYFITRYLIKLETFFFDEVEKGTITFESFHKEWAKPTQQILRFLIIAFAVIVIFPYLPGSGSPFFQGITVFIGVLFSLGSTSAIANIVAGVVITYMRPFKIGDRVKIADTTGDVIEKTLLVTRVRTIKNVDVTIPNAMVLGSHIINFSSSASEKGLILHTTVTIGYDVPWKKVHELLIAAADENELILKDPKPFVLQTSLDDFYVSYELNGYTNNPESMAKIYSVLHSVIQDKFNEAGVEIMSPHYGAIRDGNQTTIPENYLPKDYKKPSFWVEMFGKNRNSLDEGVK